MNKKVKKISRKSRTAHRNTTVQTRKKKQKIMKHTKNISIKYCKKVIIIIAPKYIRI